MDYWKQVEEISEKETDEKTLASLLPTFYLAPIFKVPRVDRFPKNVIKSRSNQHFSPERKIFVLVENS